MKGSRPGRLRVSTSAAIALAAAAAVCAAWAAGAGNGGWAGAFLRSRVTLFAGGVSLAAAVALYLLAGTLWRLGEVRRAQRKGADQAGTAVIEFALVFPIALLIVLVMVQSMLLVVGNLAVHYAAYAAARAAVVWVPEKLSYGEPRNMVENETTSAKFHRVRSAAVYALMPVSAGKPGAGGAGSAGGAATISEGVRGFLESYQADVPAWVHNLLDAKFQYAWDYTEVTLQPPAAGPAYGDHEDLRVRVRHMLYLAVPYVDRIFGEPLSGGVDYGAALEATYALTNQGVEDDIDVEQFPRTVGRDEW